MARLTEPREESPLEHILKISSGSVGRMAPRTSLTEYVAMTLQEAIIAGAIAPGRQLKQDVISAELNVSPAPVREALRQLENVGLVHRIQNRGVFVTETGRRESLDLLLPIRKLIESYALKGLLGRMTAELVNLLQDQIEEMRRGATEDDFERINRADLRFHEIAISASGFSRAAQLWSAILPQIRMQFRQLTPRQGSLSSISKEHSELLDVLRAGTADELDALLEEHIVGTALRLMEHEQDDRDPTLEEEA